MINKSSNQLPNYLRQGQITLFAVTTGAMIANLYYAQPLLAEIGSDFGLRSSQAGILVTLTQLGYAAGVLFIAPLGDYSDRKRMTSVIMRTCILALLIAAFSQRFIILEFASLIMGITSSATMVISPYVASHVSDEERGLRVGQIMTGLLLGILLARTISGLVASYFGWRIVYLLAAITILVMNIALQRIMQSELPTDKVKYWSIIRRLPSLLYNHPILRQRSLYTLLGMASFGVLWNGITLFLSAPPYEYSPQFIGLFGLLGAAGALSAGITGRLVDRGLAQIMTGSYATLLLVSWGLLVEKHHVILFLIIGVFLLDVAAQGLQVIHQSLVYKIDPNARSRLNAIYITSAFIGMSLGSMLANIGYENAGWTGVCIIGAGFPVIMILHWGFIMVSKRSH